MIDTAIPISLGLFALAMVLTFLRLMQGPDVLDRILALDTLYTLALAVVIVLGILFRTDVFFEVALVMALLGFVATVVAVRYVSRGDVIEADPPADPHGH